VTDTFMFERATDRFQIAMDHAQAVHEVQPLEYVVYLGVVFSERRR
jgi:hypothetical protein